MRDEKKAALHVSQILRILSEKIEEKPEMIRELGLDLSTIMSSDNGNESKGRPVGFDCFSVYGEEGETILREKLEDLDLETLKGILDRHDFDPSQFAQKWDDTKRIVDLIVKRVAAYSKRKGRARGSQPESGQN